MVGIARSAAGLDHRYFTERAAAESMARVVWRGRKGVSKTVTVTGPEALLAGAFLAATLFAGNLSANARFRFGSMASARASKPPHTVMPTDLIDTDLI